MGDDRRDVESGAKHPRRLVPGLEQLPTVDPPDRQTLEDRLVQVDVGPLSVEAEQCDLPSVDDGRHDVVERAGVARHLECHVEPLAHPERRHRVADGLLAGMDGGGRSHPASDLEPVV